MVVLTFTNIQNGDTPEEHTEDNTSYIHICEVKEFIKELQEIVDIAEKNFHEDDFKNYWKQEDK